MNFWQLPGPLSFLDDIQQDLLEGRNVVINVPSNAPAGLQFELKQLLAKTFAVTELAENGTRTLRDSLIRLLDDEVVATAEDLSTQFLAKHFAGTMFWLEPTEASVLAVLRQELEEFQRMGQAQQHGSRCLFAMYLSGQNASRARLIASSGVAEHAWDDRVTRLDMMLYAAHAFRRERSVANEVAARVAASVALFDPAVVDRLRVLGVPEIVDAVRVSLYLPEIPEWKLGSLPCWEDGSLARMDGVDVIHPGHPSQTAIFSLIWRAQLEVLFPLLELRRLELIACFRGLLEVPMDSARVQYIIAIEDLEFSDIHRQLLRLFQRGRRIVSLRELHVIETWRRIRNSLAHREVIGADLLLDSVFAPLRVTVG